jgi:spore coat protein H
VGRGEAPQGRRPTGLCAPVRQETPSRPSRPLALTFSRSSRAVAHSSFGHAAFARASSRRLLPLQRRTGPGWGLVAALGACWLAGGIASSGQAFRPEGNAPQAAPGTDLFSDRSIPAIQVEITPAGLAQLRRESRRYVSATVRDGKDSLRDVGVHLKGSTGSFRSIDDHPSLTLSFARFTAGQTFYGLHKIHLNNSIEDPSRLNEKIGSELFRNAGVPAARAGWAVVELNGRKLGLYVLKEGFTEDFLGLHFKDTSGNLYEGSGHDVDAPLPRELGPGPDEQTDLKALARAVAEPDLTRRWAGLEKVLDLGEFISFMATEVMIGHRDGYGLARNNYRIYHDPGSDRMIFLPHGLDQLFGRADAALQPRFIGLAAGAVLETPEGRRRYRERLGILVTNAFDVASLSERADRWAALLRPALGVGEVGAFQGEVAAVKERMRARHTWLLGALSQPEPKPLEFVQGAAPLTNWVAVDIPPGGSLEQGLGPDGRLALGIRAGPLTMASWRCKVLLPTGHYRFEGAVTTRRVEAIRFGKNRGAGLRVSGVASAQPHQLTGDQGWASLQEVFEVADGPAEVELICELRARAGEAWFDLGSLRLLRLL